MPTITLPSSDPTHDAYVADLRKRDADLRKRAAAIGEELAHAELGVVARIIVETFGPTATRLLIARDENDHGHTDIVPLVLFDNTDSVLWFNDGDYRYDSRYYPGADNLQDVHGRAKQSIGDTVTNKITDYLVYGYDAAGVCGGALDIGGDTVADKFFGFDVNLLTLDIPAALTPWAPVTEGL